MAKTKPAATATPTSASKPRRPSEREATQPVTAQTPDTAPGPRRARPARNAPHDPRPNVAGKRARLTEEQRRALEISDDERAEVAKDAQREDADVRRLQSAINGRGRMKVEDEADALDGGAAPVQTPAQPPSFIPSGEGETVGDQFDSLAADQPMWEQPTPAEILIRKAPEASAGVPDADQPTVTSDDDALARAFGARTWRPSATFDWCRDSAFGRRHTFTRFLHDVFVLVDIYPRDEEKIRAEVADKRATIARRNAVSPHPIGYVPMVLGVTLLPEQIERARRGELLELLVPAGKSPQRVDTYDSVRATSGDPLADARARGARWKPGR